MSNQPYGHFTLSETPWQWWRARMPITHRWAYFDHAAVSPLPSPTQAKMVAFADEAAENGTTIWPHWAKQVEELRATLADWIKADVSEICLIPNTSYGINIVAEGYQWNPGDNVLIVSDDFPSNRFPWENQVSKGIEVRSVTPHDGRIALEDIAQKIDGNTQIIAVSWISYSSGFRLDLDSLSQLAHSHSALLFIDGIQGMGMYPLDVSRTPIDFLAADGHKWMLGPEGAGFCYIRKQHIDRLRCTQVGWHSVQNSHDFANAQLQLRASAARFEAGSANMVGLISLAESVSLFQQVIGQHGEQAIANRVLDLADLATQRITEAGGIVRPRGERGEQSSIFVFDVPGTSPQQVRSKGLAENVVLSCRGGGTRVSIHAYNDEDDIRRLADLVKSFAS